MATNVEVGNIQARIVATTGRFESAIRRVNSRLGSVKTSSKSLQDRIKSLNRTFDDLHQRFERVSQVGSRLQRAFGAAYASLVATGGILVKLASDANETRNKFRQSFGDMTEETLRWVDETAAAYGRSRVQVQQFAADLQAILAPTLENREQAAEMSKALTTLAFDLASFHNVAERETLERLRSGLLGSTEAVDQLGINLRQTALEQEMLRLGWRKSFAQLTEQEKILLRFNVIMRATRDAQGDVIRNSREFANASRALTSALQDAGDRLGQRFLPRVTELTLRATQIVQAFNRLDDAQIDLIARFGALTAATMAAGFAFSTLLVILPQFVKGLQIVMGVMSVFASPWVLGIAAVIAAAYLLKRAWDENLGSVQERTEAVTTGVRRAWERLVNWFTGERDIMEAPAELFGSRRRISPDGRLIIEPRERGRFALPSLPAPDWDKVVDDAANRLKLAWENAKQTVASFAKIELPGIEWPGWPQIDTEPLKTQWQALKAEIEALEPPSLPRIDTDPFFESWDRFVEGVRNLEPPPPPPGLDDWIERISERFKSTPAGQITLNVGELSQQVMAGEKTLAQAITELITSNISIPFTAALWTLTPLSTGWKLALTGVTLALNFLPDVDLSAGNINRLIGDVSEKITALLRKEDLITIGDETYSVSRLSESLGRVLGEAIAEAIGLAIGIVSALLGIPELDSRAYELGKAIGQEIIVPFARGLAEGFSEAIRRAWRMALEQETQEHLFQIGLLPGETRRRAQELSQQLEGREFFFEPAPAPGLLERWRRWWRGLRGFQEGTPWTGWGPLNEVAGVVHRQEAVIPADVLRAGPAAVLEFLGAPGFQTGKLGAPLGMATLREEGAKLTQLNERSLRELVDLNRVTEGLSAAWDRTGAKLEEMAASVPVLQDLVRLVRTLVDLVRTSGEPPRPTATLHIPEPAPTLWDRVRSLFERGLGWLREQGQVAGERMREFGANILQALTPVALLTELLTVLAEPVAALLTPITMVAAALAQALLPVFKTMFPIIKTFGIVVLTIAQGIATVWNAIVGTIGNIFKALSEISILGWRPLKFLEGTANFFLGLQVDTKALADAQKELRDLTWEEAMARDKNIEAIERTTEALRNVPTGFKVALERFRAATPIQSFATGGYVPATPGGRIVRVAEGGEGEYIIPESRMGRSLVVNVTVEGDVYGVDDLDRRITSAIRRALRQGSMATFGVS